MIREFRYFHAALCVVALAGSVLSAAQPSSAAQSSDALLKRPASPDFIPSVSYAHPGGEDLVADLYLPKGTGTFPGIIFIHGGGWSSGDRTQLRRQAAYMADRGMFSMAIEYRLAPQHPYPAALEDARQAILWLREHSAAYHVDPSRIAVVGSSAGGHLAAMLGTESPDAPAHLAVQAVVIFNGIFDLSAIPAGTMVPDFLGKPCVDLPAVCKEASPLSHVQSGAPPFLVMHGNADQTAPYTQATAFVDKMHAAGNAVELFTAEGGPHTFWAKPAWLDISQQKMSGFLCRTLCSGTNACSPECVTPRLPASQGPQ